MKNSAAPIAAHGFGQGLVATLVMSIVMFSAIVIKVSPMPAPIPVALVKLYVGFLKELPAIIAAGLTAHFLYGGFAGAIFLASFRNRASIWTGLLWGIILWLIMQVVFLPILGWGIFGITINSAIAIATLIQHATYGITLGYLGHRYYKLKGKGSNGMTVCL